MCLLEIAWWSHESESKTHVVSMSAVLWGRFGSTTVWCPALLGFCSCVLMRKLFPFTSAEGTLPSSISFNYMRQRCNDWRATSYWRPRLRVGDKDGIKKEWRTWAPRNVFDTTLAYPRFGDIVPEPSSQTSKAASVALLSRPTLSSDYW